MASSARRKKSKSTTSDREKNESKKHARSANRNDGRKWREEEQDDKTTIQSKPGKIALLAIVVAIIWKRYRFTFPNYISFFQLQTTDFQSAHGNTREYAEAIPIQATANPEEKIDRFLSWLEDSGASVAPSISISSYPDYGGYGLIAVNPAQTKNIREKENSHINSQDVPQQNYSIYALQDMFTIPSSIITSSNSVIRKVAYQKIPLFRNRLQKVVTTHFQSPMVQQDIIIALQLMVECTIGENSALKPYLDILPDEVVPRLDTFDDEELAMLQDEDLKNLAKGSFHQLRNVWNENNTRQDNIRSSELQDLLLGMIQVHVEAQAPVTADETLQSSLDSATSLSELDDDGTCTSFEAFHKYISIVSSRAMVLRETKYLTPMADMANYAPRNDGDGLSQSNSFELYHYKSDEDDSITVRADRSFRPNEQIFEDYGNVDNSLYLEAHGFVPDENPHHCAMILSQYLPTHPQALSNEFWNALVTLNIVPPSTTNRNFDTPIVCVKSDGTLNDNRAVAYLKLSALFNQSNDEQQMKCMDSIGRADTELRILQCLQYDGHAKVLHDIIRKSARHALCSADSSLEDDVSLLDSIVNGQIFEAVLRDEITGKHTHKMETALKFRISEKRILSKIGEVEGSVQCPFAEDNGIEELGFDKEPSFCLPSSTKPLFVPDREHLAGSMHRFNDFLDSLDIPIKKIEPALVGDGSMRIGAIATDDFLEGETYISIGSTSTISIDTSITARSGDDAQRINGILERYRSQYHDGCFNYLVFFIMYEKFVLKDRSKWNPYLNLLPTVSNLKRSSPLLLDDGGDINIFDSLAGSDLRKKILHYRQKARNMFREFSLDYDIVMALGVENMIEVNYLWAHSIVDSRSIWWDGKRHLVPLLDLVNCSERQNQNGSTNAAHNTVLDSTDHAVTEATTSFRKGEQVYENYAQPNYIYFLYHGFILVENSYDCALWEGGNELLQIGANDEAAKDMTRTRSRLNLNGLPYSSQSFCIKDGTSLDNVANFIRIKLGIKGDNLGVIVDDVVILDYIETALKDKLDRYSKLSNLRQVECHEEGQVPSFIMTMETIVKQEFSFFQKAYDDLRELKLGTSYVN